MSDNAIAHLHHLLANCIDQTVLGSVALVAGAGLSRMARWSRVPNLLYAGLLLLNLVPRFIPGLHVLPKANVLTPWVVFVVALFCLYPLILILLFQKASWKAAFTVGQ